MKLTSKANLQIQKPIEEVFESIVNPEKMTQYFISGSSGKMKTGVDLKWKFPEFPDWYPVTQVSIEAPKLVSFVWDPDTQVRIELKAQSDGSTVIEVTEGSKENTPENIEWMISNTGGWSNFLACMKAYLEYGIQLRKGAYEFMRQTN